MKTKDRLMIVLGIVLSALFLFGAVALAAGNYGTADDPLVTLSYLTDVFRPEISGSITEAVEAKTAEFKLAMEDEIKALEEKYASVEGGAPAEYSVITIESGKTLVGEKGCEIMLRVGSAYCVAALSPGLIDTSDAAVIENGTYLSKNHMYMVTIDGRGVRADGNAMVIVRGRYTIE